MDTLEPLPDFRSMLQELGPAFEKDQGYRLTAPELEVVYLSLCRLQAIEEMALKRDWDSLCLYCPTDDSNGQPACGACLEIHDETAGCKCANCGCGLHPQFICCVTVNGQRKAWCPRCDEDHPA